MENENYAIMRFAKIKNIALNRWRGGTKTSIFSSTKPAANAAGFLFILYNGSITFKEMVP